jgi:predicted amidohydrolase
MEILLAQMDIKLGDKERNLGSAIDVINSYQADLYLFPELFTTGFDYPHLERLAEPLEGDTVRKLQVECGGSFIGGTILERDGKKFYNTFVLISADGLVGRYRKIHPFREEKEHFGRGKEVVVVETEIGKIGMSTCYDIRFPELYRELMKAGAQLALISAEFPVPRQHHWDTLVRARAIENQFFVAAVNRVGRDDTGEYFGSSQMVDPYGSVLAKSGSAEEFLSVAVDLSQVERARRDFPAVNDIRLI